MEQYINLIQKGDVKIPYTLLANYKKLNLTDIELIILIFLLNTKEYNPMEISSILDIKLPLFLEMVESLKEKGLIQIKLVSVDNIKTESISFDYLYEKLALMLTDAKHEKKETSIYDNFEKELGRTLSPIEYEIVDEWLNNNSEELLLLALKEATYNGVSNFRYIDRIIHDWNKKGIKTKEDVNLNNHQYKETKEVKRQELFDYDWLNDN